MTDFPTISVVLKVAATDTVVGTWASAGAPMVKGDRITRDDVSYRVIDRDWSGGYQVALLLEEIK